MKNLTQLILSQKSFKLNQLLFRQSNQKINNTSFYHIYSQDKTKNISWCKYFYYQKPLNLLFSTDTFLFEFFKKVPQRKKISEFKLQLKERKKLKIFYGFLSTKQFMKAFNHSQYSRGYFSNNLLSYLEHRLDVVIYRSNFVKNINQARQYITHKKILVNNSIITNPSYMLKPGDIISIDSNLSKQLREILKKNLNRKIKDSKFLISEKIVSTIFFNKKKDFIESNKKKDFIESNKKINFFLRNQIYFFLQLILKKIQKRTSINQFTNPYETVEKLKYFLFFTPTKILNNQSSPKNLLVSSIRDSVFFQRKPIVSNLNSSQEDFVKNSMIETKKNKLTDSNNYYYRNILFNILVETKFHGLSPNSFFFKLRKFIKKKPSNKVRLKSLQFYGEKPLHLEISYKIMKIIFLYAPQRIYYPFYLDVEMLKRSKN